MEYDRAPAREGNGTQGDADMTRIVFAIFYVCVEPLLAVALFCLVVENGNTWLVIVTGAFLGLSIVNDILALNDYRKL